MDNQLPGKTIKGSYKSNSFKKNMDFPYQLYIPSFVVEGDECALIIGHDGLNPAEAYAAELLGKTGEMLPCVVAGLAASKLTWNGSVRNMRMDNYDLFSRDYPDFIVEEFIPYLISRYGLNISPCADMHMSSGGSSGGISAWNLAWMRNDYFRRVYMSSPTFSALGNGNEYPAVIRKTETKPVRVCMEYSENEPNDYFGSSYCVALEAKSALQFARYDMECSYFAGEGHCSRRCNNEEAEKRMRFIWKDWKTCPIVAGGYSRRAEKLIAADSPWEEVAAPFPEKVRPVSNGSVFKAGEYTAQGDRVVFCSGDGNKVVADGFKSISSLALSSDKARLYIADRDMGCVYAMMIEADGSLCGRYIQGVLHRNTDFYYPGAVDICVDAGDRIYASTEVGIQAIRSGGMIDVIILPPAYLAAERIEFGQTDRDFPRIFSTAVVFEVVVLIAYIMLSTLVSLSLDKRKMK